MPTGRRYPKINTWPAFPRDPDKLLVEIAEETLTWLFADKGVYTGTELLNLGDPEYEPHGIFKPRHPDDAAAFQQIELRMTALRAQGLTRMVMEAWERGIIPLQWEWLEFAHAEMVDEHNTPVLQYAIRTRKERRMTLGEVTGYIVSKRRTRSNPEDDQGGKIIAVGATEADRLANRESKKAQAQAVRDCVVGPYSSLGLLSIDPKPGEGWNITSGPLLDYYADEVFVPAMRRIKELY